MIKLKKKAEMLYFLEKKINGKLNMTYEEIANATGYHPKYLLRMKKKYLTKGISLEHGNKNRKPSRAITPEEERKIIDLYRRSNASIRKFSQFYQRRSYSCIYNTLKKNGLIS